MAKREKVDGIPTVEMPRVREVTLVRGAAGCGKTARLLGRVRELLEGGAAASEILVLCATPDAARAFAERLGVPEVRVACARELALELLARPDAVALFGHGPRVLVPFEEDVLFEDLKTSGLELDRLRGMLSFFERSMSEVSDDHPDFLMDDDERAVMGVLRRGLELRGAYLEQQLSANAARYLASDGGAARWAHVVADDWQQLSRASQVMAALLAGASLCVASDPAASDRALEAYPYAAGVEELLAANPQADVVELGEFCGAAGVGRAVNALRAEAGLAPCCAGQRPGELAVEVLADDEHEVARVAELVADAVARGVAPQEVYVAAPNPAWSARVAQALAARGLACACACDWADLACSDDEGHLKVLTAVLLAGDASDDAAWRSWCAFDEPLAASGEVARAAELAAARGLRLHELLALPGLEASELSELHRLRDAYRAGAALLERVRGMGRDELFRTLTDELCGAGAPVSEPLLRLARGTAPDDGAATVRARILDRVACRQGWERVAGEGPAVRVGGMGRLCGLSPRVLVFAGFVNGFVPRHGFFDQTVTPPGDVARARAACARTLSCALAKASDAAAFTAFTKMPCALAEELGAKVDRIGLEKRVRMARVSPSIFCDIVGTGVGCEGLER